MTATLTFYGAAGSVTGSNFLFEYEGTKILIDCGLFQGNDKSQDKNDEPFPYNSSSIDTLFVSHAHLDHTGRIPVLIREGFSGKIYSTPPTKDITALMFEDSVRIMSEEARRNGKNPLYTKDDVQKTLSLWETVPYEENISSGVFSVSLKNTGHILGSAAIVIERAGNENKKDTNTKLVFTSDLGNSPIPLLPDAVEITDATHLVIESVYGDREHEDAAVRRELLEDVIEDTVKQKGVLMIPAFSVERTQEILFEIESMIEDQRIPPVPVFLDSPLAIKVTEVYKKYKSYFNKNIKNVINAGDEIFSFSQLRITPRVEESKAIAEHKSPKIILAGSGMSHGGRILHHEKRYLGGEENIILFVGYQAPGTLGREIQDGARSVEIDGDKIPIKARRETIHGYSAHRDVNGLTKYVANTTDTLKKAFVVMGEPKSASFFAQRLRDYLGVDVSTPTQGESVEIEF
jgi:metallo-beta-lactamase family protein